MNRSKLTDYLLLSVFVASLLLALALTVPGVVDKGVHVAQNLPWAIWHL